MCNEAVNIKPLSLKHVPDHFKMQEMGTEAVSIYQFQLCFLFNHFKTKKDVQQGSVHGTTLFDMYP